MMEDDRDDEDVRKQTIRMMMKGENSELPMVGENF